MSAALSSGIIPPLQRSVSASNHFGRNENVKQSSEPSALDNSSAHSLKNPVSALSSTKLVNQTGPKGQKMKANESGCLSDAYPMDKLLAKLSEQQAVLKEQNEAFKSADDDIFTRHLDHTSSSNSVPITPATDVFPNTAPTTRPASASFNDNRSDPEEVFRLKLELAQAHAKLSRAEQELVHTRTGKPDTETPGYVPSRASTVLTRENTWPGLEDGQSDSSDAVSVPGLSRARAAWGNGNGTNSNKPAFTGSTASPMPESGPSNWYGGRGFSQGYMDPNGQYALADGYGFDRLTPDTEIIGRPRGNGRRSRFEHRYNSPHPFGAGYDYSQNSQQFTGGGIVGSANGGPSSINPSQPGGGQTGLGMYGAFQQHQAMATALSPHATEFTSVSGWKTDAIATEGQTYLPPTEPLNYRRLLDRTVNCNWKYIVDKIVCNNDQQASIFLQQKLKVSTPEQKYEIVEAIIAQAYPLMVNRFGNFLVQRCFEHGTPEQVIKIAEAIRGNTLNLSMDPFGCHVVQKAFDSVPEDYKAIMVHELLRRIPETVIHRYACHVWQKLFELRWQETPPQIMKYVNDALRGMWHEVALGETGSLVVQNIFENCLEEDKRPCIEEVLANIDIVAHGQFGNWCIQHICEHGAPADRSRAIDHVIRYAAEYSTDQFASKVVEKCLKIGEANFLSRYLDRVCEGRPDRPRIPLIDIASDQYGNYLIQYILTNSNAQHREVVIAHIRKHMVSLRGSKFGSRVGMLCTNPAVATRPGPGVGPGIGSRMGHGPRYGGAGYR